MYDRILLPTDGSETAERATNYARVVAEAFEATVHVVHVVNPRRHRPKRDEADAEGAIPPADLEEAGRDAIAAVEELLDDAPVESAVMSGVPHEEILGYVGEHDVELVVMGTHGRTGLDRLLLGSTTARVLRKADVPVLTVGPDGEPTETFENVLVPTDGSDAVEPAVDCALDFAEEFGATVHALSIVDIRSFIGEDDYVAGVSDAVLDALESQAESATNAVAERARARDVAVVTRVHQGIPTHGILDYVEDNDVDLVAMGTHGRTGLDRLLLGSVTERVVRKADVPVLTARRARK